MKKFVSVFIIFSIIAQFAFVFPALTIKSEAAETENKCGDNITWMVDTVSGELILNGTGKTYEYKVGSAPWDKYADYITSIVVSEGITHLFEGTFNKLTKAVSLSLPSTIKEINTTAGMMSLETITFADGGDIRCVNTSFAGKSIWYKKIPDGSLIYFGTLLQGFKGDVPENTTIRIADGTVAIRERAFYNQTNIVDVVFPYSLISIGFGAFYNTGWYNSQPDGLVYAGSVLLSYKGTMTSAEADCVIKEGTLGIADYAFNDNKVIRSVTVPATVEEIGIQAFCNCLSLSKAIICSVSSLKTIHERAFYGCFEIKKFEIPETVVEIGCGAFTVTGLTYVYIPESVMMLEGAFSQSSKVEFFEVSPNNLNYYSDSNGVIFSKDKTVLYNVPAKINMTEYTVPSGVLYIYDEAFAYSCLEKVNFNDELQGTGACLFRYSRSVSSIDFGSSLSAICKNMFLDSWALKEIVIPTNIEYIENGGLQCKNAEKVYFLSEDVVFEGKATTNSKTVFHCYTNSTAQKHAEEYGVNYVLFDDEHYTVEIEKLLTKAEGIYRPNYTDESLAELDAVLNKIDLEAEGLTQYQIDGWCVELEEALNTLEIKSADYSEVDSLIKQAEAIDRSLYTDESLEVLDNAIAAVDRTSNDSEVISAYAAAIESAVSNLKYKPADYSVIDDVKAKAEVIDRTLYTPESLEKLDKAIAVVDYDLTIDKQAQIAEWADAIETAMSNLEYLPADYSAVEAEIKKANALDKRYYSELSLIALDAAINAVDYRLNITEQDKVNGCAQAIANAIKALDYASIVLRHEPCGVIVSATTKEIKPDTVLTVEEVDSSNYEGTNFAVGGSIRSLHFYDINLVYEAAVVQPDGTVTVKIKLADGVDPQKCKVYHVTEDIVNPLVRFASAIDGNYIVFETDHFSEFAVIEVETVVDSIEISCLPAKTEYGIGEQLDITGLKVVAHYSDGASREITDYNVGMVTLNTVGAQKVTVYYTYGNITKTAEFEITVSAEKCFADITENGKSVDRVNKKLGLFAFYSKASVQLDCNVKNADGCTLRWSSDNSKVFVDENGKVTCKGLFGAKKANITVEVVDANGNIVARDTVSLIFYKLSFQLTNTASQAFNIFKYNFVLQ